MTYKRFIERHLGIAGRWNSPKFLIGESYSGIRDAMLASLLQQDFIELTGVVAMSTIMDTSRLALNFPSSGKGPDEWYIGPLPTFAMSAQALGKSGQGQAPAAWAEKARTFTRNSYAAALMQGDALPAGAC
ncbi:hypothetical protein [Novosphingobium sp. BL-52-GroH]|uniref:hypothetical protein n=1 Tax=Novosphingobium sp. BL-52-GroH TaxID=3349877 RepID=UPI00384F5A3B